MLDSSNRLSHPRGRSTIQLMIDLRLDYAAVSTGLVLLGFFWNNLAGFTWQYVALIVGIFFANVFIFVVNDFYDASYDFKDPVKRARNLFCSSDTKQLGKVVLYTSLGMSLFFGGIVSLQVLLIIVLFNFLAFSYSAPPIKLRNRPYWDWIFVFLWKGLIISAGYVYFFGINLFAGNFFIYGILTIILLHSLISQLDNQLRDFEVDKANNTGHSAQRLGYRASSFLKLIMLIIFFGFSFIFCYLLDLYITMTLILLNISFFYFVNPKKYSHVFDLAVIWIAALFYEHFMALFSYRQQL
ncbi:MAG: UbiA family prenyltransferase, partial [Candidatus Methanofastidiosia archaeon]